jgi:hypothetical protein
LKGTRQASERGLVTSDCFPSAFFHHHDWARLFSKAMVFGSRSSSPISQHFS